MKPNRLKLYYNYLGDFDSLDKEPQSLKLLSNSSFLTIQNSSQLDKNTLIKSLILEVLTNKRFLLKNSSKIFSKNLLFAVTLRKENLYLFLDNCLNTLFLCEQKLLTLSNLRAENKLYFYLNNELINHFCLVSNQYKCSLQFSDPLSLSKKGSNTWLFYFIPKQNS